MVVLIGNRSARELGELAKPSMALQQHLADNSQLNHFLFQTHYTLKQAGTAVAQWLKCRATNRKVAGSIPAGVSGFFIDIKSFRPHYGPGVDSASNRNEYREYFLGVKAAGA